MKALDNNIDESLVGETAKIPWKELQVFFAGGKAIFVSPELDLIKVAAQIAEDNKAIVEQWVQEELVIPVPDNKAKQWYESDTSVWAVVVKPWVLVQEIKQAAC